jgi:hypothetical protein
MRRQLFVLACVLATPALVSTPRVGAAGSTLTLVSARVTLDGTSNIHPYTASTTAVRLLKLGVAAGDGDVLERVLQPGGLTALDVAIPAIGLTSPKEGIDKNMHKALKATEHHDIRFQFRALEQAGDGYRVTGLLTIAGVEKPVTLATVVARREQTLAVTATTPLLMTDYGITPPKAMLGMLKTNPEVRITIELELGVGR